MIKFLAGVLLGTLLTLAGVYTLVTRAVSDYVVTEKVLTSSEWENSLASLQSLQDKLSKYTQEPKPLCEVFCDRSPYDDVYGAKATNKIKTLEQDLQARGKKVFADPGFLLDLVYVERAMAPIQQSGVFSWMRSASGAAPQASAAAAQAQQSNVSSQLAMTAPRLLMALQSVQDNLKSLGDLRDLRQSCPKAVKAEVRQSCEILLKSMSF